VRKRRIDAKARGIARNFLAGKIQASETCLLLSPYTYWNTELFSDDDKLLIKAVGSETDNLPVGTLAENWHPDFLPAKLAQLAKYDSAIGKNVKELCERLIGTTKSRKLEQGNDEDS
jgi:hypothetical protein